MKKFFLFVFLTGLLFACSGCAQGNAGKPSAAKADSVGPADADSLADVPKGAQALIKAYPQCKLKYEDNKIIFADGSSMVYDDGVEKDFIARLDNADIEDMFVYKYDMGPKPEFQADGGRCRCDAFFMKIYGNNAGEVRKHLVNINWYGKNLLVSAVNGVNKQLEAIQKDLSSMPEYNKYFTDCGGTFNWRVVRGTKNRLSAHSYGMTMDVNTSFSNYWLWENKGKAEDAVLDVYNNRIPEKIVEVFEKYGFIWGGRWYHYDTMHFEYRPEILIYHGITPIFVE